MPGAAMGRMAAADSHMDVALMTIPHAAWTRRRRCFRLAHILGGLLVAAGSILHVPTFSSPHAATRAQRGQSSEQTQAQHLSKRRDVFRMTSAGLLVPGTAGLTVPADPAIAMESPKLTASWVANEGVDFLTDFNEDSYGAMRDDVKRTPTFIKAIRQRLVGQEGKATVLDIGTGPFALFALVAARAGAKKVYAIEANPEAVARAKAFVAKADDIPEGTIEIIEGFSTAVTLPEKADLVVAEIMGGIASEENCIASIRDAKARHLKNPDNPASFIPMRVQTFASPVSYALHPVLAPPRYERLGGVPLRVNCRDRTVQLLSDPQIVEDFKFAENLPGPGKWQPASSFSYSVSAERLQASIEEYTKALKKEGLKEDEATTLAQQTAKTFSGVAFWPRLIMDEAGELIVDSRGPLGEAQKSHWQTVLALMSPYPVPVSQGDKFVMESSIDFQRDVISPGRYNLNGNIIPVAA